MPFCGWSEREEIRVMTREQTDSKTSLELEIERLLQKLREEVDEEGLETEGDSFWEEDPGFEEERPAENDGAGQGTGNRVYIPDPRLHYERPLRSSKKSVYNAVIFVKRLIRKCARFLIVPILDEQSSINYSVKEEIDRLNKMMELQGQKIEELQCRGRERPQKNARQQGQKA